MIFIYAYKLFKTFHKRIFYEILSALKKIVNTLLCVLSCIQLVCNPVDCSLAGSSVYGILQARILEWVAIAFSRGSSQPRD